MQLLSKKFITCPCNPNNKKCKQWTTWAKRKVKNMVQKGYSI